MYVRGAKKHHRIFLKCNNQQHSVFGTSQSSHSLVVSQIVHFYKNWVDFQKQILARCSSSLKLRPVVICRTCWWIHFYYGNYYFVLLVTMLISWWRCRCCVALAQFSAAILLLWLFKRPESCAVHQSSIFCPFHCHNKKAVRCGVWQTIGNCLLSSLSFSGGLDTGHWKLHCAWKCFYNGWVMVDDDERDLLSLPTNNCLLQLAIGSGNDSSWENARVSANDTFTTAMSSSATTSYIKHTYIKIFKCKISQLINNK